MTISIHALREEGDRACLAYFSRANLFLSTPSARRATDYTIIIGHRRAISIHALREEGDHFKSISGYTQQQFLSTPSARRATLVFYRGQQNRIISIHALREEGDLMRIPGISLLFYFYPRPPRGGRPCHIEFSNDDILFLSTPSARRATGAALYAAFCWAAFLSTPSARRATCLLWHYCSTVQGISIHALREEGDHLRMSHL